MCAVRRSELEATEFDCTIGIGTIGSITDTQSWTPPSFHLVIGSLHFVTKFQYMAGVPLALVPYLHASVSLASHFSDSKLLRSPTCQRPPPHCLWNMAPPIIIAAAPHRTLPSIRSAAGLPHSSVIWQPLNHISFLFIFSFPNTSRFQDHNGSVRH